MAKQISQFEITRYWEIFTSLLPPNTPQHAQKLTGDSAASVLKNSGLTDRQLERIWDISDIDNDGDLDFEEFCVAMRLVFDLVNGEMGDVPQTLPDWLVPEGKAYLVQAGRAVSGKGETFERPQDEDEEDGVGGLKDGFDWYMPPAQKREYEDIYSSARDGHGYVAFDALVDLYISLEVPDTDVRSAWNLVNPSADEVIGKDACLAFLHVLRGRHDGFRIPRTVPPSLRASFEKKDVDFSVDRVRNQASRGRYDESTTSGRKAKFGDSYLSRLGGGAKAPRGTDFGKTGTTSDWEEVRLKKQLRELEAKIERVEQAGREREKRGGLRDSKPALVKRELEQLLDYKRRELRDLEASEGRAKEGLGLRAVQDEINTVKEQVDGLAEHLKRREQTLQDLQRQIKEERGR